LQISKEDIQNKLLEIQEKKQEFNVIFASYGIYDNHVEVTDRIRELFISSDEFKINNENMGVDPLFGFFKHLLIIYESKGTQKNITAKEYYLLKLEEGEIKVRETKDSKEVYNVSTSNSIFISNIHDIFPGVWEIINTSDGSSIEQFIIMNNNGYYKRVKNLKSDIILQSDFTYFYTISIATLNTENLSITFSKSGALSPQTHVILQVNNSGKLYTGYEGPNASGVIYRKVGAIQ
jgi:hypothetical protein